MITPITESHSEKQSLPSFICNTLNVSIAIEALRLVMAGGTFVPASLLEKACDRPSHSGEQVNELTRRQKQVVDAIRKGKPNKIIAYELGMCESTVKVHVRTIMKKLNATNRTHLVHVFDAKYACSSLYEQAPTVRPRLS